MIRILSLLLALCAIATSLPPSWNNATIKYSISAPFQLRISSRTNSLDGLYVVTCHEGAAIESLCVQTVQPGYPIYTDVFQHNISYYGSDPLSNNLTIGVAGDLIYTLIVGIGNNKTMAVPQVVRLGGRGVSSDSKFLDIFFQGDVYDDFEYGPVAGIAFDNKGLMNMQDVVYTNATDHYEGDDKLKAFYRWYVCTNFWMPFYRYHHLMWKYGSGDPSDRSCKSVSVKRIFV